MSAVESGDTSYREQIALVLWRMDYGPSVPLPEGGYRRHLYLNKADMVLAVRDAEMERLRAELEQFVNFAGEQANRVRELEAER